MITLKEITFCETFERRGAP